MYTQYENTSALTPDGGLINGVGALSQGEHPNEINAGQHSEYLTVPITLSECDRQFGFIRFYQMII